MRSETVKEKDHPDKPVNWLQKLTARSWEMELLIVGFALLVLLKVPSYLTKQMELWSSHSSSKLMLVVLPLTFMLVIGAHIMKFNLVIHLLLRGYWIGVIGLNSVYSKGVSLDQLSFVSFLLLIPLLLLIVFHAGSFGLDYSMAPGGTPTKFQQDIGQRVRSKQQMQR